MTSGAYQPLLAPATVLHRTKFQQLPTEPTDIALLDVLWRYLASEPVKFEYCAAELWRMAAPAVEQIEVTRPSRDGGRDAVGQYGLGPAEDRVRLDFALEAKCYQPGNSVGVREVARLISRLRFRQFGVLVTTSFVHEQAYREIRSDAHPVVILAGADLVRLLRARGLTTPETLISWLEERFA